MSTDLASPESSTKPAVSKSDLKQLLAEAATGDTAKIERLLAPFLTPGERLLWCGISAKMGWLTTYDFAFLTDQRVGDLEVTPRTGALNVEICYLQHIDASVIVQPSITFKLISTIVLSLPLLLIVFAPLAFLPAVLLAFLTEGLFRATGIGYRDEWIAFVGFGTTALLLIGGIVVFWMYFGIRMAKRSLLHFYKSGIYFKLRASEVGSFVFADRDKFAMITSLARMVTEQKRVLDRETN